MHQPTIMCDGFVYEEGEDLDEEELAANAVNLPKALQALPGTVSPRPHFQAVCCNQRASQHYQTSCGSQYTQCGALDLGLHCGWTTLVDADVSATC